MDAGRSYKMVSGSGYGNTSYKRKVFERYGNFVEGTRIPSFTETCANGTMLRFVSYTVYHSYIDNAGTSFSMNIFMVNPLQGFRCKNFQLKRWIYDFIPWYCA